MTEYGQHSSSSAFLANKFAFDLNGNAHWIFSQSNPQMSPDLVSQRYWSTYHSIDPVAAAMQIVI